jgi:hypothetical protein
MSDIDKIFAEREAKRAEKERQRRARFDVAAQFLTEFFERDVKTSQALAQHGIEAKQADDRILLHRIDAGVYADAFQIAVGPEGEIDAGGRSLGQFAAENRAQLKRELIADILTFFDL